MNAITTDNIENAIELTQALTKIGIYISHYFIDYEKCILVSEEEEGYVFYNLDKKTHFNVPKTMDMQVNIVLDYEDISRILKNTYDKSISFEYYKATETLRIIKTIIPQTSSEHINIKFTINGNQTF